MDYKDIEQLLERYWQCETSVGAAVRPPWCHDGYVDRPAGA